MGCIKSSLAALALGWGLVVAPGVARAEVLAVGAETLPAAAPVAGNPARDAAAAELLAAAGVDGTAKGRELFVQVLGTELFAHEAVGPFDLYIERADGFKKANNLKKTMGFAREALEKLLPVFEQHFPREGGILSGQRFPIVLVSSKRADGERAFDQLLGLLDRCEDEGYSKWKPWSLVWDPANLAADTFHTWDVLIANLEHPAIREQGQRAWFAQPFGFAVLQALSRRLLAQGAWGTPVPWLAQGLVDELDIEAHGRAWVGAAETGDAKSWSSSNSTSTTRTGWSGFLRDGEQPPPPKVTTTSTSTSSSTTIHQYSETWGDRSQSTSRHWKDLASDRKSKTPASFRTMAEGQSFEERDRALSRLAVHLLLDVLPSSQQLLAELDRQPVVPETLMRDSDPLPVILARALGGVPAVDALEAKPMREVLELAKRQDLIAKIEASGGAGMLELTDHRKQAEWLYYQIPIEPEPRRKLELAIQEAEYEQERLEWVVIGEALDVAVAAALEAEKALPESDKDRAKVAEAMTAALDAFRASERAKAGG